MNRRKRAICVAVEIWCPASFSAHLTRLVAELAERGLKIDYRLVWEFVHAENLSSKKGIVASEPVLVADSQGTLCCSPALVALQMLHFPSVATASI